MTVGEPKKVELEDLPPEARIKLDGNAGQKLWKTIENQGIKQFAQKTNYQPSQLYNWKNKQLHIPATLLTQIKPNLQQHITSIKAGSNSKPIKNPELPWKITRDLYTRVKTSTSTNKSKQTIYRTKDPSLIKKFDQQLQELGQTPTKTRKRSGKYELIFPWILRKTILQQDIQQSLPALLDEKAEIQGKKLKLEGSQVENPPVKEMSSTMKKLELGAKVEQQKIIELMRMQRKPAQQITNKID